MTIFRDRIDAAKQLSQALLTYKDAKDTIVVALPRGGVVLGRVIADVLRLPLDIVVPRKIGHPGNEEYAIGAITVTGDTIWNEDERLDVDPEVLKKSIEKEHQEAKRRLALYRSGSDERDFNGKTILVVDDGIATGLTMFAAVKTVKTLGASHIIVAIPGGPQDTVDNLKKNTNIDAVMVLETPRVFFAVGQLYQKFGQVEDDEVIKLMKQNP